MHHLLAYSPGKLSGQALYFFVKRGKSDGENEFEHLHSIQ